MSTNVLDGNGSFLLFCQMKNDMMKKNRGR